MAKEVWRARRRQARALPLAGEGATMRRAWQWMRSSEASWKTARGPIAVAKLEIGRLGWQIQDDFRLEWNDVELT